MRTIIYLQRAPARAAVGPREHRRPPLGGAPSGQQVVEQRGAARADEGVERGHREDAQLVEGALGSAGHVGQQRLQEEECDNRPTQLMGLLSPYE